MRGRENYDELCRGDSPSSEEFRIPPLSDNMRLIPASAEPLSDSEFEDVTIPEAPLGFVKVRFPVKPRYLATFGKERMWVIITIAEGDLSGRMAHDEGVGEVNNDPQYSDFECGDLIVFKRDQNGVAHYVRKYEKETE